MFLTRWILIEVDNHNLTVLVETTLLMKYEPIYWSTSFFTSLSLNTKSFILNIILSPFFYPFTSLLLLSTCYFIFFYAFLNTALVSSCIFFSLFSQIILLSLFFLYPQFSLIICYEQRYFCHWIYFVVNYKFCWG